MKDNKVLEDKKKWYKFSFLKKDWESAGTSLNALVWKRFRKDKMAMASLVVIVLFALVAVLGYAITPDSTPYCNQQYLELAVQKPMSKARFLYVEKNENHEPVNFFETMLYGKKLSYYAYPIYSYTFVADSVEVETYTGSVPNDGEKKLFHLADVAYALNSDVPIVYGNDAVTFQTIDGEMHTKTIEELQTIVEENNLAVRTFYLGTDRYGRDVLSQIMLGSRVSLSVGFIAIAIALLIGILLGAVAAYYGRWVDSLIMWFINVVWSIPTVLLVIAITFVLGKGFWQVFVAVGLTMWVDVARVVRGQVLSIRKRIRGSLQGLRVYHFSNHNASYTSQYMGGGDSDSSLQFCLRHLARSRIEFFGNRCATSYAFVGYNGKRKLWLHFARFCLFGTPSGIRHNDNSARFYACGQWNTQCF